MVEGLTEEQILKLKNAAEQFIASCGDGNVADLLDYYEDIFRDALGEETGQ